MTEHTEEAPRLVDQLLTHYGQSHQHPTNERIHLVAIPLIMLSLIGLIYELHPFAAYVFVGASLIYYLRLSHVFLLSMGLISVIFLSAVQAMGAYRLLLCGLIFVVAWIFQFIGHKLEGKKPSFFEDIQYLWVGPLFVLRYFFVRLGVRW